MQFHLVDLSVAVIGGLLGSLITAVVSLWILRKQFLREEIAMHQNRAADIMKKIEGATWLIIDGFLYEHALEEKYYTEFENLPGSDGGAARADLHNRISEEQMRVMSRIQEAERELVQQKAMLELFVGQSAVLAFEDVQKQIPALKESLGKISPGNRKIRTIKSEEASNWSEYCEALAVLRKILWNYAKINVPTENICCCCQS